MARPEDPGAFVAAAERAINARDLEATCGVYAPDARLESLTDGAWEAYEGLPAVRRGWAGYLAVFAARDFRLAKTLRAVDGELVVNDWTGTLGGRTDARGIEHWRFDAAGRVATHRMYSFLNVKPSTSPVQRARLAATYPLTALAFLREGRRA